jgi:membrane protease subunit (stomatin/prohibitin family)
MRFCTNCGTAVEELVVNKSEEIAVEELKEVPTESVQPEYKEVPKPTCVKCGNELQEGMRFCTNCGTAVDERPASFESRPKICLVCGSILDEDAAFCDECGAQVTSL